MYCQARGGGISHDRYLDEPVGVVAWQVGIHGVVQEIKNRNRGPEEV